MPRHARIQSASGIYHVMARGNNRENIVLDDEDFYNFIKNLFFCCQINEYNLTSTATEIYAFCVLNNHFHLLIKEDENGIAHFMRRLMVRYAQYFKKKYVHIGHLFQDRFKSVPVEDEAYLLATYRYIAMNPVKAKICALPEDYTWSSFFSGTTDKIFDFESFSVKSPYGDRPLSAHEKSPLTGVISPLPVSFTNIQLNEFVHSDQQEIDPFPERITEAEALRIMVNAAEIAKPEEFSTTERETQIRVCRYLKKLGLSTRQIARITKLPRSRLAGWLDTSVS